VSENSSFRRKKASLESESSGAKVEKTLGSLTDSSQQFTALPTRALGCFKTQNKWQ